MEQLQRVYIPSVFSFGEIVLCGQSIQLGVQHEFECSFWEVEDGCFPGYVRRLTLLDTRNFSLHQKALEVVYPLYLEGFVDKFLCSFLHAFHVSCGRSFLLYLRYITDSADTMVDTFLYHFCYPGHVSQFHLLSF